MDVKKTGVWVDKKDDIKKVTEDFNSKLVDGEVVELAYRTKRDRLLFTNKRIIIINIQGITGKKQEFHTIKYSGIYSYSMETSGTFDLDAELKIWASGLGGVEIKFLKGIDTKEPEMYLANKIL